MSNAGRAFYCDSRKGGTVQLSVDLDALAEGMPEELEPEGKEAEEIFPIYGGNQRMEKKIYEIQRNHA